jgi:hypothetical protein
MPAALYNEFLEEVQIAQEAAWGDAAAPTIGLAGITSCKMTPKVLRHVGCRYGQADVQGREQRPVDV